MDPALREAFCATHYRFGTPDGELLLRVDAQNATLATLLRNRGADCAAVITAFNPQGNLQEPAANRAAQQLLRSELLAGGYTLLPGRNEDPSHQWPAEESLLVLGISQADTRALAARHDQLAFLWTDAADATPRLIETSAGAM